MTRGRPREFDEAKALQAALDVFWRKGYEGASCDDLLSAMGINSGSMYAAFGDKQSLYDKAFELFCQSMLGEGMKILDGPGTPLENVKAFVQCWGDLLSQTKCKGCFIDNTLIEFGGEKKGVAKMARGVVKRMQGALQEKLQAARELGELSDSVDPAEMAAFLINTKQGLSVMARAGAGKKALEGIVKTTLSLLH